jgi:hypothetical protein
MHFDFHFSAAQILWTLTFASLLVLLVVLYGRERTRRFPWFTASMVLVALRLISSRLLFGRLPELTLGAIFVIQAEVASLVGLCVLIEIARRAFSQVKRRSWNIWALVLLAIGGLVLAKWGPWPAWKSMHVDSPLAALMLTQMVGMKTRLLTDVITIGLGILVVLFGRRYGAGWRSHVQMIAIGLSTASMAQLGLQGVRDMLIRIATSPGSGADPRRLTDIWDKVNNANGALYIAVVIWWIVWLWMDEPGANARLATTPVAVPIDSPVNELPDASGE